MTPTADFLDLGNLKQDAPLTALLIMAFSPDELSKLFQEWREQKAVVAEAERIIVEAQQDR